MYYDEEEHERKLALRRLSRAREEQQEGEGVYFNPMFKSAEEEKITELEEEVANYMPANGGTQMETKDERLRLIISHKAPPIHFPQPTSTRPATSTRILWRGVIRTYRSSPWRFASRTNCCSTWKTSGWKR